MPIGTSDGEVFKDRFEMLTKPFESAEATPVPNSENNAPVSSPGAPRGIVDKLLGQTGERYQLWPEKMARSALGAMALPGDVLAGKVEPDSIQAIERAADLAGVMVAGPAPVASKMAEGTLGSFAGVTSKTLDKTKLYKAQNMELDAVHPDDIWTQTGFFRGADNRWRYEIPDQNMKLKLENMDYREASPGSWTSTGSEPMAGIKSGSSANMSLKDIAAGKEAKPSVLSDVVDHPEFFKAYPELADTKIAPLPKQLIDQGIKGQVSGDTIYLAPGHPEYIRSVLGHEMQHLIQKKESFARGGNTKEFEIVPIPQAKKELADLKNELEPQIKEAVGGEKQVTKFKNLIQMEMDNALTTKGLVRELDYFRTKDPTNFERLKNIVLSERLIRDHENETLAQYRRLVGEVEARNVQSRMDYDQWDRKSMPPNRTEDTARFLQIVKDQNQR